jgi:hypothetical protein
METPKQNLVESSAEKEKQLNLDVVFIHYPKSVEDMLNKLESASTDENTDTAMLDEYAFNFQEIIDSVKQISQIAKAKNINLVMAPDNTEKTDGQLLQIEWGQRKRQLQEAGIEVEDIDIPDDFKPETIGFYFNGAGQVYVFPKVWDIQPVHKIPNTKIGISICGEIGRIKEQDLDGIDVLYNPSREKDDPNLRYRMMGQYNKDITREDIAEELRENDDYYKNLFEPELTIEQSIDRQRTHFSGTEKEWQKKRKETIAYLRQFPEEPALTVEEKEKKFNAEVDRIMKIIQEQQSDTSMYVKNIENALKKRKIPVIRCDGYQCSGVLNPMSGLDIEQLEYKKDFSRMKLKFNQ